METASVAPGRWCWVFSFSFFLSAEKASEAPSWFLLAALQWLSFQGCFIIHRLRESPFWSCSGETVFLCDSWNAFPVHQACHWHATCKLRHLQSLWLIFPSRCVFLKKRMTVYCRMQTPFPSWLLSTTAIAFEHISTWHQKAYSFTWKS